MFTQDIVEFLNRGGSGRQSNWLASNPSIQDFVTCPRVLIRPAMFTEALRVSVIENQHGRFITMLKRSGARRYILQICNPNVSVDVIEKLIRSVEGKGGVCRVERIFLIIDLPLGYLLDLGDEYLTQILTHPD